MAAAAAVAARQMVTAAQDSGVATREGAAVGRAGLDLALVGVGAGAVGCIQNKQPPQFIMFPKSLQMQDQRKQQSKHLGLGGGPEGEGGCGGCENSGGRGTELGGGGEGEVCGGGPLIGGL